MKDQSKTKQSLIQDLASLREKIAELEKSEAARKKLDETLRESEDLFRSYLEYAPDGVYMSDLKGTFLYGNRKCEEITGYRREELIGKNFLELNLLTEKSLNKAIELLQVNIAGNSTGPDEIELISKEGRIIPVEINTSLVQRMGQEIILAFVRNITERKHVEKKLLESEANYRQLFDNSPTAIYQVDFKSGRFLKANDLICEYIGCSQEEITSLSPYDLLTEQSKKLFLERLEKIALGVKVPETVEYEVIDKKGKRWFLQLHTKHIYDAEGHVVAADVVAHDITERKRAEEKLKEILENLRKSIKTTIQVLGTATEARDPYTAGHQKKVADLARVIATEMGFPLDTIEGIRMAGSIHDIGKISIPSEILSKPTKLAEIEFALIKEHARSGFEMLKDVESPWPLAEIVYQHHERMNGSGYPRNLKGDEIIMESRVLAVADVVEAMASHRPYRPTLGIEAALEEIEKNKGILYDNTVADACLRLFREKRYQLT